MCDRCGTGCSQNLQREPEREEGGCCYEQDDLPSTGIPVGQGKRCKRDRKSDQKTGDETA